jgi:Calpain family cysteine protease
MRTNLCIDASVILYLLIIYIQQRFVLLKDVWKEGKFNGDWCSNSSLWNDAPELSAELSANTPEQCFWMAYEDVCSVFNTVVSVNLMSSAEYEATVCGTWSIAPTTACIATDNNSVATSAPTKQSRTSTTAATTKQCTKDGPVDCSTWLYTQQYHIKIGNDADVTGTDSNLSSDVLQNLHAVHIALTIEDARYHKRDYKQAAQPHTAVGFAIVQRQPSDDSVRAITSITAEHKIM